MNISKTKTISKWSFQLILAAIFLIAGVSKLASATQMVQLFETIGLGQWFRYLTGALEVIGAVGLLIPRATFFASTALATVMLCAVATHIVVIGGNPLPAIALFIGTTVVSWVNKPENKKRLIVS